MMDKEKIMFWKKKKEDAKKAFKEAEENYINANNRYDYMIKDMETSKMAEIYYNWKAIQPTKK